MAATYPIDCGIIYHSLPKYFGDTAAELAPDKHPASSCSSQLSIGAGHGRKPYYDFPDACLSIRVCNLLDYPAACVPKGHGRSEAAAELLLFYIIWRVQP